MSNGVYRVKEARSSEKIRFQSFILLMEGALCLIIAWVLQLNPLAYPIGVLVLGIGLMFAAMINYHRLAIASWLIVPLGIAVFMAFKNTLPGQVLSTYILAIGIGLLGIAFMARQGYVSRGAISPALLVIVVGIIEYLLAAHFTPSNFVSFALSLWMPAIVLLVLGGIYLVLSLRG